MKRWAIATLVVVWQGLACVSNEAVVPSGAQPYPLYTIRPPEEPPTGRHPRARIRTRELPPYRVAWYPRKSRLSSRWRHIVIHHSATATGGAKTFDKHHRQKNGWDELGYHFVIGNGTDTPDGVVEVGPRWHKQKHGAHCKTPDNAYNEHGIGICLVGDFTQARPTPKQLASLTSLVRFLQAHCRIPPERLTTHHAINSLTRCPGRFFELKALRRAMAVPSAVASLP